MTEQEIRDKIKKLCVDEWVWINWNSRNHKYFLNLGYQYYTDYEGKKYWVIHPWDLQKGSHTKINLECLKCGKTHRIIFKNCFRYNNFTGLCSYCNRKIIGESTKKDLIGQKFERLTVIKDTGKRDNSNNVIWLCKCDCGNIHEVAGSYLINGSIRSCGCLQRDRARNSRIEYHKSKGHFIKSEHTQEEIYEHLEKQAEKRKDEVDFNKQIAKDREYLCYFTAINEWGNITVHHINSRDKYPNQVYDFNNLICLRKDIHKLFHQMYGYGNNNVDQFYEFLTLWARNKEVICE